MTAERAALDALIESVADGTPVDWSRVEGEARDEPSRRHLRDLRLVAEIAALHKSHGGGESGGSGVTLPGLAEGTERWGHLILLEKIGEGSFGDVYRARDPWLDREVALKLLKPTATAEPTSRVLREAQTLARVRHPNVVQVYGADVQGDRVGLWMELLRGRTLEQLLTSHGPFGAAETAVAGQELCRALAAVHAAGLVHRDIKATNVMREPGGRLVLMDFGAGQRRELADAGPLELVGTPLYLSPEVLAGRSATTRSDIYSLGVLLYHLATGDYPVSAASLDDLRDVHARGATRRLSDVRPDLPEAFVRAIERALNHDPERRYASAGEMQAVLAEAVASESPTPTPPGPRTPQWRRILLVAAAVTGTGLAVATGIWPSSDDVPLPLAPDRINLLAVLPFENGSTDPAESYLANAVPMELTARLGHVGALKVVPWTFMRQFDAGAPQTLDAVAERTGADAIVEGTVQRVPGADGSPGPVQVHVRIFSAGTRNLLWSASLERHLGDFFVLQAQIAREIVAGLRIVPATRDQALVSRSRQVPQAAMEDYLKARQLLEIQMNFSAAAVVFSSAIELAPNFAEAFVGLAWSHALESAYAGTVRADTALERSVKASSRAIELDPNLPEAWAARAFARFALEGNWSAAESDVRRALELGPESSEVLQTYSNYLTDRGRHAEAIEAALQAESRAPFSVAASRQVAWAYYMARQPEHAIKQARRTLEIEPGYAPARTVLARALLFAGQPAEGIRELESAGREYETMLAAGYALAGRREDAVRLLDRILSPTYDGVAGAYDVAQVYAALGDDSRAIEWLETAYQRRDSSITELAVDPMLDRVRDDPRFVALLQKVGPPM
jgi:serine/threonine protein kinase/tetratricopeptide (TPR) repeat protein